MWHTTYKFNVKKIHFVKYLQHTIILYCLKLKEASLAGGQGFVFCLV